MLRINSGKGLRKASSELATDELQVLLKRTINCSIKFDEFYEEDDQLFLKYSICNDVELQQPLPGGKHAHIVKHIETSQALKNQAYRAKGKCFKCKQSRHNACTCERIAAADVVDFVKE